MKAKVIITAHPETGKVFTQSFEKDGKTPKLDKNGKPYGFIRVQQSELTLGFAYDASAEKKRSALISMTVDSYNKNKHMIVDGAEAPGKIVRQDSLTPWFEGQKPLTIGGENAQEITSGGSPVYRKEFYTERVSDNDIKLESYDRIEATVVAKKEVLATEE